MGTRWMTVLLACGLAASSSAQTKVSLKNQGRDYDFGDATRVRPMPVKTSLPSNCIVGDMVFDSNASPGHNLQGCVATDTWSVQGLATFFDPGIKVTRTSANTLTIGQDCNPTEPCHVRFGSIVYSITAPGALTVNSGTGTVFIFVNPQGIFTVAKAIASGLSLNCSSCQVGAALSDFPLDSLPVWTWTATSSGVWDTNGGVDRRAIASTGRQFVAGSNIAITETGSSVTISSTNFLPTGVAINGATMRLGGTIPASATQSLFGIGNAITGGAASGTAFGMNAPSGFSGDMANWLLNGQSVFRWTPTGGFSALQSSGMVTWWGNDSATPTSSFRLAIRGTDSTNTFALGAGTTGSFLLANGLRKVAIGTTAATPNTADLLIQDATPTTGSTQVQVQSGEGQDRDLMQIRNFAGAVTARITSEGALGLQPAVAKPACSASYRGVIWFTSGGAGVADKLEVCAKDAADAYQWSALF